MTTSLAEEYEKLAFSHYGKLASYSNQASTAFYNARALQGTGLEKTAISVSGIAGKLDDIVGGAKKLFRKADTGDSDSLLSRISKSNKSDTPPKVSPGGADPESDVDTLVDLKERIQRNSDIPRLKGKVDESIPTPNAPTALEIPAATATPNASLQSSIATTPSAPQPSSYMGNAATVSATPSTVAPAKVTGEVTDAATDAATDVIGVTGNSQPQPFWQQQVSKITGGVKTMGKGIGWGAGIGLPLAGGAALMGASTLTKKPTGPYQHSSLSPTPWNVPQQM